MNKNHNTNQTLIQFILRAQQLARHDAKSERGYAMLMTSMISIAMLSMLAAYMTMTNLSKSSTNAYVDGTNTFYAAESGLNKRAQEFRQRFANYTTPSGTVPNSVGSTAVTAANIVNCFKVSVSATTSATDDFECRNYPFKYNNNIAATNGANGDVVLSEGDGNSSRSDYIAHTFVAPKQNYATTSPGVTIIPSGETYTGLRSQEYQYTVYATATKLKQVGFVAPTFTPAQTAAKNRIVKIAGDTALIAAYDAEQARVDDLNTTASTNSGSSSVLQMEFKNRVIPIFQFGAFYNGDLEFNPSPVMTFTGRLHSNASMYLTAGDANSLTIDGIVTAAGRIYAGNPSLVDGYSSGGQVLITKSAGVTQALPANTAPTSTAVEVTDLAPYNSKVKNVSTPVSALTMPSAGLLTKVDTSKSDNIGEYYGKADLRLEMFPNRAVPFNFQVLASGTTDTAVTCEGAGSVFNNTATGGTKTVSISRNKYNAEATATPATNPLKCTDLNEGQLRSLMQPVLVRPRSTLEHTTFCTKAGAGSWPRASTTPVAIANTDLVVKERILDALALTISAQTTPINYSTLATAGSIPANAQFRALLTNIAGLSVGDINLLDAAAPTAIAALASTTTDGNTVKGSCFRPAPIQALFNPANFSTSAALAANTATNFNDRREGRYIRMLQTNIESMTLWNRDGLFTQGLFDGNLTTSSDAITPANLAATFTIDATTNAWSQQATSSGNNLLFVKDIARTVEPGTTAAIPAQSYRGMGLAAVDRTEGGLVIHATINKTTYSYPATQSPYGFAFNDGANLPAPLTIATDQAVYSQGDWNRFDKQPASFLADSLSLLSESCLAKMSATDASGDTSATASNPAHLEGEINCGRLTGIKNATATIVNAAFLARTDASTATYYSGGLNNYMRILENWGGRAMTYRGSFVSLGAPQEVSGQYAACTGAAITAATPDGFTAPTYGCPPNRAWSYDTDFDTFNKLPPLSPRVIELKQDVFKRSY
jgi:Tfp pilus assembly protein PilX